MAPPASKVLPLGVALTGLYLTWFGVQYWRSDVRWPSDPLKAVLTGKPLPANTRTDEIDPQALITGTQQAVPNAVGIVLGSTIAQKALQYRGKGYVWGGNASSPGQWDCSSFVSYVLGHDLNITLPGGGHWGDPGYPPHAHGPTTLQYMLYGTGIDLAQVEPGDLIVSVEHIGIAISKTEMISAQDESSGTGVAGFPQGFPSGPPLYRRVLG